MQRAVEIEEMQLKEVKKDLGDEFSILEDGIYARAKRAIY